LIASGSATSRKIRWRRTYIGETRYNDRWPDLSPTAQAARDAADAKVLDDLAAIPRGQLPPAEQLNYDLFKHDYEMRKEAAPFHGEYYSVEASGGPQSLNEVAEVMPFATVKDYETWLRRMRAFPPPRPVRRPAASRRDTRKRTQPRVIMERVLPPLAAQCRTSRGQPVLRPLPQLPRCDPGRRTRRVFADGEAE
jgi:uncharacterized protein (DUF885 family)